MKLPSYRMVEDIPAPEGVVTPEGDHIIMVDLLSASARESVLRRRIEDLEDENAQLRRVQEDLISRALDRLLNETT